MANIIGAAIAFVWALFWGEGCMGLSILKEHSSLCGMNALLRGNELLRDKNNFAARLAVAQQVEGLRRIL